ncbi:MAG: DUF2130 domain-containing protein [Bacteroidetes bacterium]|jgi:hypothetical protein|nr:DUF2130 domain-containing protein [Bacteroidota bacterium]MBK8328011.1 DUF2130 domain-containing protein [Bacteroidota bacterium]HQW46934.1 DUF2130 domain-containing protein [Chitinophagaceae bacterium]
MTTITCPHCKTPFNIEEVLTEDVEKSIRLKYETQNKELVKAVAERAKELEKKEAEFEQKKKNENDLFIERVKRETDIQTKKKEEELIKKIAAEHQSKIDYLLKENEEKNSKLRLLNEKELEVLNLNKQLTQQKEDEEFKLKKQRLELEAELKEKISGEVLDKQREKHELEKREYDKKLADQHKLIEEMQRKMQQGSMQTQGEILELALEDLLGNAFPFDTITEVGKGKRGADCILIVRNEIGQECGKIIFESKRTKDFDKKWIPKLKEDMLEATCDMAILVSQILPEDIKLFDQREGVWLCKLNEVTQLVKVIREGLINVARANRSQENKGEKKEMLYNYFTGNEFLQQMRAINEAYLYLKASVDKERFQMEKIWKEREKQIDKVLLNNTYLMGTIKGIAGNDIQDDYLIE